MKLANALLNRSLLLFAVSILPTAVFAEQAASSAPAKPISPDYQEVLAKQTGADDYGMRKYVLVILKSGPNKIPAGAERDEMFKGHFANMNRLAEQGVLAVAGPLDGVDGWRGLFILAVETIEEAQQHVATDPVIIKGEMVAEYHKHYSSAALMLVNANHKQVAKHSF